MPKLERHVGNWRAVACYGALLTLLSVVFGAQFFANDLPAMRDRPLLLGVVIVSLGLSLAGWGGVAVLGRRVVEGIGTEGLVTIGLVAGLHFVVTYTSMIAGVALRTLLGPMA